MGIYFKTYFFLSVLLFSGISFENVCISNSDDKKAVVNILKKSNSYYQGKNKFQLNTTYKIYATKSSKQVKDSFKGLFACNNDRTYAKINQTEFIISSDLSLKIDNESKLIQFSKNELDKDLKVYDLEKYCSYYNGFKLTETEKEWICTLTTAAFSFVPYSKVVIYINKANYNVSKQILYIISAVEYKDSDGKMKIDYPRLEIEFDNLKTVIDNENVFNIDSYILLKNGKYYPSKKYNTYKVID
ncbi:hypothetical protein [Flavobacterium sp.]|uniref:hypothetical protein n=1 Tax=Flavobacterium sp. TaxID=239 RepID=UPI00391D61A5